MQIWVETGVGMCIHPTCYNGKPLEAATILLTVQSAVLNLRANSLGE